MYNPVDYRSKVQHAALLCVKLCYQQLLSPVSHSKHACCDDLLALRDTVFMWHFYYCIVKEISHSYVTLIFNHFLSFKAPMSAALSVCPPVRPRVSHCRAGRFDGRSWLAWSVGRSVLQVIWQPQTDFSIGEAKNRDFEKRL